MGEYFFLNLFGKKILGFFFSKAKGKAANWYKGYKKKKYNEQFLESLNIELLKKYGDKDFYDKLSKIIICDDVLNEIYKRCYSTELNNYGRWPRFVQNSPIRQCLPVDLVL